MRSGISLYTVILLLLGEDLWNAFFLLLLKENLKSLTQIQESLLEHNFSRKQKSINLRWQLIKESEFTSK